MIVYMYIYIYVYMYMYVCNTHIYIYVAQPVAGLKRGPGGAVRGRVLEFEKVVLGN